jgi:hypothetical protein
VGRANPTPCAFAKNSLHAYFSTATAATARDLWLVEKFQVEDVIHKGAGASDGLRGSSVNINQAYIYGRLDRTHPPTAPTRRG